MTGRSNDPVRKRRLADAMNDIVALRVVLAPFAAIVLPDGADDIEYVEMTAAGLPLNLAVTVGDVRRVRLALQNLRTRPYGRGPVV